MLGDHARPIRTDLGEWETEVLQAGDFIEERVVAAGRLGAALQDVPGDEGTGQRVPVVTGPAVPPRRRADDERSVGDPTGQHHLRAGVEGRSDTPAAEVG